MMFFLCNYCHGQGHNKETCLKRLTKNCPQHICRDFNRYRQPTCEINGSCVYNRLHACMICNEAHCKAFLHVNQRTEMLAESLKKSKDNSKILSELVAVVQKVVHTLKSFTGSTHSPATHTEAVTTREEDMQNPAVESIPTSLTHEELNIIASNGILALPIVSAEKEITMPVSTGYPLSSVSLKHAKVVISSLGNTISIVPLKEAIPSIKGADGTLTKPCGTLNVPITFANKRTFHFQMLVVSALTCDLIFGNNHLVKTDAVINHSKRSISFNHEAMNFELNCTLLTDLNSNRLHAFTSNLDVT